MATSEELVQWSMVSYKTWITHYPLPISSTVKYPRRRYRLDSTLL
jgi:hypothetical protein